LSQHNRANPATRLVQELIKELEEEMFLSETVDSFLKRQCSSGELLRGFLSKSQKKKYQLLLSSYLNLVMSQTSKSADGRSSLSDLITIVKQGYKIASQVLGDEEFKLKFKNVLKASDADGTDLRESPPNFKVKRDLSKPFRKTTQELFKTAKFDRRQTLTSSSPKRPIGQPTEKKLSGYENNSKACAGYQSFKIKRSAKEDSPKRDVRVIRINRSNFEKTSETDMSDVELKNKLPFKHLKEGISTSPTLFKAKVAKGAGPRSIKLTKAAGEGIHLAKNKRPNLVDLEGRAAATEEELPKGKNPFVSSPVQIKLTVSKSSLGFAFNPQHSAEVVTEPNICPPAFARVPRTKPSGSSQQTKADLPDFERSVIDKIYDFHENLESPTFNQTREKTNYLLQMDQTPPSLPNFPETSEPTLKNQPASSGKRFSRVEGRKLSKVTDLNNSLSLLLNNAEAERNQQNSDKKPDSSAFRKVSIEMSIENTLPFEVTGSSPVNLQNRQSLNTAKKTSEIGLTPIIEPIEEEHNTTSLSKKTASEKQAADKMESDPNLDDMTVRSRLRYLRSQYHIRVNSESGVDRTPKSEEKERQFDRSLMPNFEDTICDPQSRVEVDGGTTQLLPDNILEESPGNPAAKQKPMIPYNLEDNTPTNHSQPQPQPALPSAQPIPEEKSQLLEMIQSLLTQNIDLQNKILLLSTQPASEKPTTFTPTTNTPATKPVIPTIKSLAASHFDDISHHRGSFESRVDHHKHLRHSSRSLRPEEANDNSSRRSELTSITDQPTAANSKSTFFFRSPAFPQLEKTACFTPQVKERSAHGSTPQRGDVRFKSCLFPNQPKEFAEKSDQDIEDTSIIMPKKSKKPLAMAQSMIVDSMASPPLGTPHRRSTRPNSLVIDGNKMKENFKGDSVTVVRTHTIESFNCTVSSYIRAFVSQDRAGLRFELSAYLNEGSSDEADNRLSRMKMDKVDIEAKDFFQILVGCDSSHLNLSPNFLLLNEHVDWLLRLLVVRFLEVEVDVQANIIRPLITSKPGVLLQSESLECMESHLTASLVHNHGNAFWLGFSSLSSHK